MKKILLLLLGFPFISIGQKSTCKYVNDTLYTSSGFKIYKGQTLYFGKGTRKDGKFRFVNIKSDASSFSLVNNSIVIKKLRNYGISSLDNGYIEIVGSMIYKDGSRGYIDIHMAFDLAIEDNPGLPSELIVPDEFRNKHTSSNVVEQIESLNKLYKDSLITKEEFEAQKKKLLPQ
ncbi:MAG: SHOCT domain-containing protein [Ferruginibacter sp.]